MESLLKEILNKLNEINSRLANLEKDMDFIKIEARSNNVSIKEIEKMVEDMDDRMLNIYDDLGVIDEQLSNTDAKIDILASMLLPDNEY